MELLVFSDSHGSSEGMRQALLLQPSLPHVVVHLGDGVREAAAVFGDCGIPYYLVCGNCDSFVAGLGCDCPDEMLLCLGEHTLFLTHGAKYGVKGGLGALIAEAARKGADLVLFGHTHQPYEQVIPAGTAVAGKTLLQPMYLFNPGSIGRGSRSFGVVTLQGKQVLLSHGSL